MGRNELPRWMKTQEYFQKVEMKNIVLPTIISFQLELCDMRGQKIRFSLQNFLMKPVQIGVASGGGGSHENASKLIMSSVVVIFDIT